MLCSLQVGMAFSSEAALIPTGARASPQLRNNQMTPNQAQSIPAHVFEETGIVLLASGILLFQSTDVDLDGNFALKKKPCLLFFLKQLSCLATQT